MSAYCGFNLCEFQSSERPLPQAPATHASQVAFHTSWGIQTLHFSTGTDAIRAVLTELTSSAALVACSSHVLSRAVSSQALTAQRLAASGVKASSSWLQECKHLQESMRKCVFVPPASLLPAPPLICRQALGRSARRCERPPAQRGSQNLVW